jgi:ParB-like chromosome segregation protein Spo0J
MWPIDRLKPHPGNARRHSEEQIAQLVASFEQYGVTHPFLADENDYILAGHGKHLAARQMGPEEVPVIVLRGLTDLQKRAYLIADNQLALNSDWDQQKLRSELEALEKELFDLQELGFGPQELDRILFDLKPENLLTKRRRRAASANLGGDGSWRFMGVGKTPAAVRRRHLERQFGTSVGWPACRHGFLRPALQRELHPGETHTSCMQPADLHACRVRRSC